MANYSTNEFKGGLKVMLDGDPCAILENDYVKPGDDRVIAATEQIGGGESTSITFSLEGLEELLEDDLSVNQIQDLSIPFIAAVTNLNKGKAEYLSKGPADKIIQASSAIPVLFSPVEMNGYLYADGGLMDNVPVEPLRDICNKTIAVDISPITGIDKIENLFQIALRTFQLSVGASVKDLRERSDLVIAPEKCSEYDLLNSSQADELFEVGYRHTLNLDLSQFEK